MIDSAGFISKQPKGRYCRFSTTLGCITHYNMTEEDCEVVEQKCRDVPGLQPFDRITESFNDIHMSYDDFGMILEEMSKDPSSAEYGTV